MGAWGPALYSDDTACDVKEEYRDLLGDGLEGPAATDRMLETWRSNLDDADVAPVFWLALAETQWRVGRLEERVRAAAIRVIDDGSDLSRWSDDPSLRRKREAVLLKLRALLESVPPPAKRIPKAFRSSCDWAIGEVVAYKLQSGRLALLRVVDHHTDRGGTSPVCELLDWIGDGVPTCDVILSAPPKPFVPPWSKTGNGTILLGATSAREMRLERVSRTGVVTKVRPRFAGCMVVLWRHLDDRLREFYGLE